MTKKHKVIQDFQFISTDKRIFVLKTGTILEDYVYKTKDSDIKIDEEIINSNTSYFQMIDWKIELLSFLKINKIPQPAVLSKKLIPFFEEILLSNTTSNIGEIDYINETKLLRIKNAELSNMENDLISKNEILVNKISEISKKEYELNLSSLESSSKINQLESELIIKTQKMEDDYKKNQSDIDNIKNELSKKENEIIERENELERKIIENSFVDSEEIVLKRVEQAIVEFESRLPHQYHRRNWHLLR